MPDPRPAGDEPGATREPSRAEAARLAEVRGRLLAAAGAGGTIRFDRFFEIALYADEVGFYASPDVEIGARGAFYTAPQASPLFGATLARRILAEHERLGRPAGFTVVEVGPGDGTLAADVLGGLGTGAPASGIAEYRLVERSEPLRRRALERARAAASAAGIELRALGSIGEEGTFLGVVVANELLDALPVRRFVRRKEAWRELEVRLDGARATWVEAAPALPPGPAPVEPAEEGTIVERSPFLAPWLREVADHLERGAALLFDFGDEGAALQRAHPAGTLSALWHHRALDDPLSMPGLADLSCFVDFTQLRSAARAFGLRETGYSNQAEALAAWGLADLLEAAVALAPDAAAGVRIRLAAKNLLFGFSNFRCLELAAGPRPDT